MKAIILSVTGILMIVLTVSAIIYYQSAGEKVLTQRQQLESRVTEVPVQDTLMPVGFDDPTSYTLQNDELNITYNGGNEWIKVPLEQELLFAGEYNGNRQELIPESFVLTEDRAAFLHVERINWEEEKVMLTYSLDRGNTWDQAVVAEAYFGMRFRKIDFLNDDFGYVIMSGGRVMSSEASHVFLTQDGGQTWEETSNVGVSTLISNGGFVDETTGFLSFGTINPESPMLYVTQDGGDTWSESTFQVPEEYQPVFVQAEVPYDEDDHLAVLVNQGPNGDYQGGLVKGKFISVDQGQTWEFVEEVQLDETG